MPAGEQFGDRDRSQARQAHAEEPGIVVRAARRASVMLGGVDAVLVVPDVPQNRHVHDVVTKIVAGSSRRIRLAGGVDIGR